MPLLFLLLTSFATQAFTWNYLTSENGKQGARVRLSGAARTFDLGGRKCTADQTQSTKENEETKSLFCELADGTKITTTANCTSIDGKMKSQNVGDLSFINGKNIVTVILYCD